MIPCVEGRWVGEGQDELPPELRITRTTCFGIPVGPTTRSLNTCGFVPKNYPSWEAPFAGLQNGVLTEDVCARLGAQSGVPVLVEYSGMSVGAVWVKPIKETRDRASDVIGCRDHVE